MTFSSVLLLLHLLTLLPETEKARADRAENSPIHQSERKPVVPGRSLRLSQHHEFLSAFRLSALCANGVYRAERPHALGNGASFKHASCDQPGRTFLTVP